MEPKGRWPQVILLLAPSAPLRAAVPRRYFDAGARKGTSARLRQPTRWESACTRRPTDTAPRVCIFNSSEALPLKTRREKFTQGKNRYQNANCCNKKPINWRKGAARGRSSRTSAHNRTPFLLPRRSPEQRRHSSFQPRQRTTLAFSFRHHLNGLLMPLPPLSQLFRSSGRTFLRPRGTRQGL